MRKRFNMRLLIAVIDLNEEKQRMRWERVTIFLRLICLILGAGSFGAAWLLTRIGASGIEDVPPPFILVAGLTGLGFLCIAVIGRYPRPGDGKIDSQT